MLKERLSKLGDSGFEDMNGSDSIAAIDVGSFNVPSAGGVGSWCRKEVRMWEL